MTVLTKYGEISGFEKDYCNVYLGIPFATSPVGELAFKHPLPPDSWSGILNATKGSCNPIQAEGGFYIGNNSLDCLYLNVFAPQSVSGPLPVMVWIYGGSYSQGGIGAKEPNSANVQYDLAKFAVETNCVVVTFNYRLNVYGFLNFHWLDDSFDQNNGLFDQIMALRFVKENIAAFGGNPNNITIFGQSAGGACILALMTMKEADGLFHKAIVQSACIEHFFTDKESRKNAKAYLKYAGVKKPQDLRLILEKDVKLANKRYSSAILRQGDIRCAFSPVIDGAALTEAPKDAVRKCKIPLLIGNTSEEANLFLHQIPSIALPFVAKYIHLPIQKSTDSYRERVSDALTDHIYIRPQVEMLKNYSGPVWRYEYQYVIPKSTMGCFHASELPVLFGLNDIFGTVDDSKSVKVGVDMRRIWADFARTGSAKWGEFKDTGSVYGIS